MTKLYKYMSVLVGVAVCSVAASMDKSSFSVVEYALPWLGDESGSTHELIFSPHSDNYLWVVGQDFNNIAKVNVSNGQAQIKKMPDGSGPHGVAYDSDGQFWVSLEFAGAVVRLNEQGIIQENIDVRLFAQDAPSPINVHPHAIEIGGDGKTVWFTGKKTSTVGKINPDRSVEHYELPTLGAVPIYLVLGPDGNIWGTELQGNNIFKVTPSGEVTEFAIPTYNSRPIAVTVGPDGKSIWFSEEAGHKVGRIDMKGNITEFPIPKTQENMILADLAFDQQGNLWTQSYVNQNDSLPSGSDYIVKVDKGIVAAENSDISGLAIKYYAVPTRNTVFHRIRISPKGNIWFTELKTDKLGKLQP